MLVVSCFPLTRTDFWTNACVSAYVKCECVHSNDRSDKWESSVEDGKLMADAEAGEFWALFGGFAPLPRKIPSEETGEDMEAAAKLLW